MRVRGARCALRYGEQISMKWKCTSEPAVLIHARDVERSIGVRMTHKGPSRSCHRGVIASALVRLIRIRDLSTALEVYKDRARESAARVTEV